MRRFMNNLGVSQKNYWLFVTINFAFFVNGAMAVMLGAILPYIREENSFTFIQTGLMFSAHQFGNFCAMLIAGALPYVLGRKKSTLLLSICAVLGLVLISLVSSPLIFMAAFILTGSGRGALSNVCNVINIDISGKKTTSLNLMHSIFALGALMSPFVIFLSVIFTPSWKYSVVFVSILMAFACLLIGRSRLPELPPKKKTKNPLPFLKDIGFWIPTMIMFFYLAAESSIVGWFVLYFFDTGILPGHLAGFVPAMFWLMIMISRASVAAISKYVHNKNRMLLCMSIATSICFAGLLLSSTPLPSILFLLGIGISMAGIFPTALASINTTISPESLGFSIALAWLGGIFMPSIVGAIADLYGLAIGITLVLAALILLVVFCILKIIHKRSVLV